jgi:hypothetical protein
MKHRESVTTNGRAVFYAACWEDLRKAALNCGWALGLHGSLNSDMDIMAMAWVDTAVEPREMVKRLCECFTDSDKLKKEIQIDINKPNNRVVYTIPIWADFYLDINVIKQNSEVVKVIQNKEAKDSSENSIQLTENLIAIIVPEVFSDRYFLLWDETGLKEWIIECQTDFSEPPITHIIRNIGNLDSHFIIGTVGSDKNIDFECERYIKCINISENSTKRVLVYKNYMIGQNIISDDSYLSCPKESFISLLTSKGVYFGDLVEKKQKVLILYKPNEA